MKKINSLVNRGVGHLKSFPGSKDVNMMLLFYMLLAETLTSDLIKVAALLIRLVVTSLMEV